MRIDIIPVVRLLPMELWPLIDLGVSQLEHRIRGLSSQMELIVVSTHREGKVYLHYDLYQKTLIFNI